MNDLYTPDRFSYTVRVYVTGGLEENDYDFDTLEEAGAYFDDLKWAEDEPYQAIELLQIDWYYRCDKTLEYYDRA